ncbi:MAG: hypothetical protein AUI42_12660 [Actinobacteria bacterium 13_1_40CM_2_65_8]|nr:MAG: hypothetical protein AUI42_12660 [Actinobacteria bacterium 13_1_40CM_2_65_8]
MIVVVAVVAITCSNSPASPASGARLGSPSPSGGPTADTKAADLRVRLDLLLGEHVILITKASLAAAANRADEYKGYATLLTINGTDLTSVMSAALGASAADRFDQIWSAQNNYFVDYTVGIVSHNADKSNGAVSGLINGFVPQFAKFMNSLTSIPLDPITQLLTQQVLDTKAIIDDQAALNNARMFADLHMAFAQSARVGDALAAAIARKFPDKFPGDPASKQVDFRVSLDNLLQEHSYLATMTTSAIAAGRSTEQAAARNALAANANLLGTLFSNVFGAAVGTRFDQVWGARDAELVVYAGNADATTRQGALDSLSGAFVSQFAGLVHESTDVGEEQLSSAARAQVTDTIHVIDEQRAKSATNLAADDHTAAAAMNPIGDLIATATVAKLPGKFAPG